MRIKIFSDTLSNRLGALSKTLGAGNRNSSNILNSFLFQVSDCCLDISGHQDTLTTTMPSCDEEGCHNHSNKNTNKNISGLADHKKENIEKIMSIAGNGLVEDLDNSGDTTSDTEYISTTKDATAFIYATSISTNGGEEYIRYYRNKLSILHPGSLNAAKEAIGYGYTNEDVSKGWRNRVRYVNSSRDSFRESANLYCRGQNKSGGFTIFPSIGSRNIGRDGKGVHNGNSSRRHLEANKALGAYY